MIVAKKGNQNSITDAAVSALMANAGVHSAILNVEINLGSIKDEGFVKKISNEGLNADILALTRLRKEEIDLAAECDVDMALVFIASSDIHIKYKLKFKCEELLVCVADVLDHAKNYDMKVNFSTEDSTRTNLNRLYEFYDTATEVGIDRLGITDTVGCINPEGLSFLVNKIKTRYKKMPIAIHLHNDFGLALPNALSGVAAGANVVATTVGGIGERAGNVSLEQFVVAMKVLYNYDMNIDTSRLHELAEMVHKFSRIPISPHQPLIGENVFSHESGMHIAAILNHPVTYECIPPELVGQSRRLLMGKHTGSTYIKKRLDEKGIRVTPEELNIILQEIKLLGEFKGKVTEDEFWNIVNIILGTNKNTASETTHKKTR